MDATVLVVLVVFLLLVLVGVALVRLLRRPSKPTTPVPPPLGSISAIPTPPSSSFEVAKVFEQGLGRAPSHPNAHASGHVLSAVVGSCAGRNFELGPAGLRIGRSVENDVVLQEPMVSRLHAQIIFQDGAWVLLDRNSVNGTFINGLRTFNKALEPGNRIQIGLSEFVFHRAGTPIPVTPPGAGLVAPPSSQPSRLLDSYRIEGLIGDGGMASVHRARAIDGHVVAIKIPKIANDAYLMRKFEREGSKIGALLRGHPHIVEIECFNYQGDGTPYIVMEYIDGGSLRERMRTPLPPQEVHRIIGETCLALGFAHQHALVHRDIKPENILLTKQGVVKVGDFGIAKELSGITVTHKGPVGTPEYMSPEQAIGEDIQPASDIYAVGIVMYELLTGQVPFPRRTEIADDVQQALDVVERHIKEAPRPPDQAPGVPPGRVPRELAAFAMKALSKDPRKRYRDGYEAAAALGFKERAPQAGEPVRAVSGVAAGGSAAVGAPNAPAAAAAAAVTARLVVVQGPQRGKVIPLLGDVVVLGRADVDPASAQISRRHLILRRRRADFYLEDISMNGTWINNMRASGELMVAMGDYIRVGDSILRLEM